MSNKSKNNSDSSPALSPDKRCAPGKTFLDGSCLDLDELISMARAHNETHPKNKIIMRQDYDTMYPGKYKQYLVSQFKAQYDHVCDNQKCWTKQSFIKKIHDPEMKERIEKYTFRPDGPEGKFAWLNTFNINDVMNQYEYRHKDFKFLGAVPIDFNELPSLGISNLNFKDLLDHGQTKLGVVFNLDEHNQPGSHWVALFSNIKEGKIYFFDSYAVRPEPRIRKFMRRIEKFCESVGCKNIDVDYNHERYQFGNRECGMFSINFILRMLKGEPFQNILVDKRTDKQMGKCRDYYFL